LCREEDLRIECLGDAPSLPLRVFTLHIRVPYEKPSYNASAALAKDTLVDNAAMKELLKRLVWQD